MAEPDDGRQRITPLGPFEEAAGFTRAIRVGNRIIVSGIVGLEDDGSVGPDAGRQADRCFEQILDYIAQLGGHSGEVVRVRMFVTNMAHADAVTAAFTRAVGHARPAATLVGINALYNPEWKCEIEAEALVGNLQ